MEKQKKNEMEKQKKWNGITMSLGPAQKEVFESQMHTGGCFGTFFQKFWVGGQWCRKNIQRGWYPILGFYSISIIKFLKIFLRGVLFYTPLPYPTLSFMIRLPVWIEAQWRLRNKSFDCRRRLLWKNVKTMYNVKCKNRKKRNMFILIIGLAKEIFW